MRKGCFICSAAGSSLPIYTSLCLCLNVLHVEAVISSENCVSEEKQKFRHRLSLMPRVATVEDWVLPVNLHCWPSLMLRHTGTVKAPDLSSTWQTHHSRFSFVFTVWHFCICANKVGSWNRCDFFVFIFASILFIFCPRQMQTLGHFCKKLNQISMSLQGFWEAQFCNMGSAQWSSQQMWWIYQELAA